MPPGSKVDNIPTVLRGSQRYEPFTEDGFWDLYRRLSEQPAVVMPALGERVVLSPAIPAGTAIERSVSTVTCANSPLALISVPEDGVVVFIPVVESHWGDQEAVLLLQPDDQGDGAVLNGLRNGRREIRIAFRENVALASVGAVQQKSINGVDQWEVKFQLRKTEFSPSSEFSTAGLGPAEAAEIRAKRLLLNQDLANANSRRMEGMMQEVLIRGEQDFPIDGSSFPSLFRDFGSHPKLFVEIAWITAVLQLKMSATVAQVTRLELTLDGRNLRVEFSGRRRKQYSNQPAIQVQIAGICSLDDERKT